MENERVQKLIDILQEELERLGYKPLSGEDVEHVQCSFNLGKGVAIELMLNGDTQVFACGLHVCSGSWPLVWAFRERQEVEDFRHKFVDRAQKEAA